MSAPGVVRPWKRPGSGSPAGLSAVLGRTRALLPAELDSPASTTELARRTGPSAGGVSQHLSALRAAGLVGAHWVGRFVLYARTAVARTLLAGGQTEARPIPDR